MIPGPGTWLIFGIVLLPVYGMLFGWFLGEPRDTKTGLLGIAYLIAFTTALWVGMGLFTIVVGAIFF